MAPSNLGLERAKKHAKECLYPQVLFFSHRKSAQGWLPGLGVSILSGRLCSAQFVQITRFYSAPTVLLLFCFSCFPYLIRIKDIQPLPSSCFPSNCQKALINSTQNHTVKDACTLGRNAKQGRKGWRKAGQKDVKFATLTFPDPRVHEVVLVARHVAPAPSEREPARLTISFSAAISLDPLPSEWTHI